MWKNLSLTDNFKNPCLRYYLSHVIVSITENLKTLDTGELNMTKVQINCKYTKELDAVA